MQKLIVSIIYLIVVLFGLYLNRGKLQENHKYYKFFSSILKSNKKRVLKEKDVIEAMQELVPIGGLFYEKGVEERLVIGYAKHGVVTTSVKLENKDIVPYHEFIGVSYYVKYIQIWKS